MDDETRLGQDEIRLELERLRAENRRLRGLLGLDGQENQASIATTVEAIFNLGTLGRNDTSATPMSGLFRGGIL